MSDTASGAVSIGVLALQGDVREHRAALEALGAKVTEVRLPRDLEQVQGLVLPGGESTTLSMLLRSSGLDGPLRERLQEAMPVFGTCAGMILLADRILDGRPDQEPFHAIEITVRRNAFGRQLESFEADLVVEGVEGGPLHAVFIRAPYVESVGESVEVLASVELAPGDSRPVFCRKGAVLVAAFHPELSGELRLHRMLLDAVRAGALEDV